MTTSTLELMIRAKDEASGVFEKIGDAGSSAAGIIEKTWKPVSAGLAAAAASVEGLARKQQDQRVSMQKVAILTGMSGDAVNDLSRELSNVTFPLDQVTGLLELAARQGIKSEDALKNYANFWDTIADATGGTATELAKAGVGLSSMGIAVGQESSAIDAMGFILKNTTTGVDEFLTFIERMAPNLNTMGLSVNDTAALLGALEEKGIHGRAAISEFSKASSDAGGDLGKLLSNLGLSNGEFEIMRGKVDGAGSIVNQFAGVVAESYTPLQKMQHEVTELGARFQGPIKAAADFAPLMLGASGVVAGIGKAQQLMQNTGAISKFGGMLSGLALGPVGLVALALAGIVTVGFLIWQNWDTISAKLKDIWGGISEFAGKAFDGIVNAAKTAANVITAPYRLAFDGIRSVINAITKAISSMPAIEIPSWVPGIGGKGFAFPKIPEIPALPSFDVGGMVPGPVGRPMPILAHGGELVIPSRDLRSAAMMPGRLDSGGGTVINIGPVTIQASDEAGGRAAGQALLAQLRQLEQTGRMVRVTR